MSTIHQKICLCELFRNAFPPIISPIIINIIPNNIFPAFFIILSPFIFICSYNITFNDICQYNKKTFNKNPVLSLLSLRMSFLLMVLTNRTKRL